MVRLDPRRGLRLERLVRAWCSRRHSERIPADGGCDSFVEFTPSQSTRACTGSLCGRRVVAAIYQVRAVAKERLQKRIEMISPEHLEAVEDALREILEIA